MLVSKLNALCSLRLNFEMFSGKKYRIPHSSYYFGPPPSTSAFGTDPIGQIGVHHPREIIRIERDYSAGDLAQFSLAYPLELEGRVSITLLLLLSILFLVRRIILMVTCLL